MILTTLATSLAPLALTALLLGVRHGFDADHLAAIDGLTRIHRQQSRPLLRNAGVLFAAGHGIVVIGTAVTISSLMRTWQVPEWINFAGA